MLNKDLPVPNATEELIVDVKAYSSKEFNAIEVKIKNSRA